MKKYISLLTIILTIISCDIEETPYVADYESYVNPDKKVLIEDFTGHLCPNCPGAAREMKAIHDKCVYIKQFDTGSYLEYNSSFFSKIS